MTGLECLRKEMEKRGCNKAQIESKTAAIVLDILSEAGTANTDIAEAEMELRSIRAEIGKLQIEKARLVTACDVMKRDISLWQQGKLKLESEEFERQKAYIEDFLQKLSECETPDGRDTMRRVQIFRNSVEINTAYDNTAFIIGLGAILSGGSFGAIDTLQQINPKLFERGKIKRR